MITTLSYYTPYSVYCTAIALLNQGFTISTSLMSPAMLKKSIVPGLMLSIVEFSDMHSFSDNITMTPSRGLIAGRIGIVTAIESEWMELASEVDQTIRHVVIACP